jgi:hypothetical protein
VAERACCDGVAGFVDCDALVFLFGPTDGGEVLLIPVQSVIVAGAFNFVIRHHSTSQKMATTCS